MIPCYRALSDGQWGEIYKIILSRIYEYPVLELGNPSIQHMICFRNGVYDVLRDKMLPHSHKYAFDTFIDFEFYPEKAGYSDVFNEYLDTSLEKASRSCGSAGNKCRELLNAAMKDAVAEGFIHRNLIPDTKPYKRKKAKVTVLGKSLTVPRMKKRRHDKV